MQGGQSFLRRWITTTIGVLLAAAVVNGVRSETLISLLGASLLLGILNAFLRPVLMVFALPLLVLTLGLFTFVINALLLYFVGHLVKGFYVADFWAAFKGSLLISIVNLILNFGAEKKEIRGRGRPPVIPAEERPKQPPDTGEGPIIDV